MSCATSPQRRTHADRTARAAVLVDLVTRPAYLPNLPDGRTDPILADRWAMLVGDALLALGAIVADDLPAED